MEPALQLLRLGHLVMAQWTSGPSFVDVWDDSTVEERLARAAQEVERNGPTSLAQLAPWAALLSLALVVSVVLLWIGLRGKRRGTTPFCRRCGYNLTGATASVCPECGAALASKRAVVYGTKQRRWIPAAIAPLVLVASILAFGGKFVDVFQRLEWYRYKPYDHVVQDLRSSNDRIAYRAFQELEERWALGELSQARTDQLLDMLLSEQAGQRAIPALHGHVCCFLDELLISDPLAFSPERLEGYMNNQLTFEVHCREMAAIDHSIPIQISVLRNAGNSAPYTARVAERRAFVNKRDVSEITQWHYDPPTASILAQVPGLGAGTAHVELELSVTLYDKEDLRDEDSAEDELQVPPMPVHEHTHHLACECRIVPAEASPVAPLVSVDAYWAPSRSDAIFFRTAPKPGSGDDWLLEGMVRLDVEFPADLALNVFAVVGNEVYPLRDTFLSRRHQLQEEYFERVTRSRTELKSSRPGFRLHVYGQLPCWPTSHIGLILRTVPEATQSTVDLEPLGDVEYRLEGIPVERCNKVDEVLW